MYIWRHYFRSHLLFYATTCEFISLFDAPLAKETPIILTMEAWEFQASLLKHCIPVARAMATVT